MFCGSKAPKIEYKAVNQLQSFVTQGGGKILPRRATGTCARHQRELAVAHDPRPEVDRDGQPMEDRGDADPSDPVGRAVAGVHAVRYPSSHMSVCPVTSSEASLARKMIAPLRSVSLASRPSWVRALYWRTNASA